MMSARLQWKQLQGWGKESSTPQVLGIEEPFCIAIQDAEDNQGKGTSLILMSDQEWT